MSARGCEAAGFAGVPAGRAKPFDGLISRADLDFAAS